MFEELIKTYTFNPASRTITFNDYSTIYLERLSYIFNVDTGDMIYDRDNVDLQATVSGNVITVSFDTTNMPSSNKLAIVYAPTTSDPVYHADQLGAGENLSRNRLSIEQGTVPLLVTADTLVLQGPGIIHTMAILCNDAAPTAGSIIIYDSLTEANTQLWNHTFTTTPFPPFHGVIDINVTIGAFAGFTTTNDVNLLLGVIY